MYTRQRDKRPADKMFFLCIFIFLPFFLSSCSLLEKEEVYFETVEKEKDEKKEQNQDKKESQELQEEGQQGKGQQSFRESKEKTEQESNMQQADDKEALESAVFYVYICGQVKHPGVYSVEAGKRVNDVLNLAGGFTKEAQTTSLNLARQVVDGEQIYVMSQAEAQTSDTSIADSMTAQSEDFKESTAFSQTNTQKVNINTASREELMTLSGIGQSKADSIIAYRQANGPFENIEEIKQIEGIKDGIFFKIKDNITI